MDIIFWLWLLKAPKLGNKTLYKALTLFESPEDVFKKDARELKKSAIFKNETLSYLEKKDLSCTDKDLQWAKNNNCYIISIADQEYPEKLKQITDPPPILYVLGDINLLKKPQLAIVGSRNPTPGGRSICNELAINLSLAGLTVISGMASGIDAQAHLGALDVGCNTIAVCGTGLDRVYPAKHKELAHKISEQGVLISEFSIGTKPIAQNFPRRNRIISGMSLGVIIIEAKLKSGSMITARLAAEQGREVFAVPGSVKSALSAGPHELLKQGAVLTRNAKDVLDEIYFKIQSCTSEIKHYNINTDKAKDNLFDKEVGDESEELLKFLSYDAISIDELVEKSKMSPQVVSEKLLMLEVSNKISKVGVATFVLN